MDSLSLKASEVFSLQTEAAFKIKEDIAIKSIKKGLDNETIAEITGLTVLIIQEFRNETKI